jgi:hypothetical protein
MDGEYFFVVPPIALALVVGLSGLTVGLVTKRRSATIVGAFFLAIALVAIGLFFVATAVAGSA